MNIADVNPEAEFLRASLARQKQIIADKRKDVAFLEHKIKENLRRQDEISMKLYPPIRPERNAAYITTLIEDKGVELKCLQNPIIRHQMELDALYKLSDFSGTTEQVGEATSTTIANRVANLAILKRKYAIGYADLEHLRSLLSPIRILPLELLGEIFMYCCDATDALSLSEAPLLLSHVCSFWRAITIQKHEMWSSLKLGPEHFVTRSYGLFHLAKLWLERSGNCPLRLYVRPSDVLQDGPIRTDLFLDILALYTPFYNRWKDIVFDYPRFDDFQLLFSDIPEEASLPLLERFGLFLGTMAIEDRVKMSCLLLNAPRLQKVLWIIKTVRFDPFLPYDQLTSLELGGDYSTKSVLNILYQAKRLQLIDICIFIPPHTSAEDLVPVVHGSLTKLTLTFTGGSSVFFDNVTLPALREIHITRMGPWVETSYSTWSQSSFVSFLSRSECKLRSFSIVDFDITSEEILAILRYLSSSLVKFEIEHIRAHIITDEVLKALTYPTILTHESTRIDDIKSVLCHCIEELRIVGCIFSTDGILADMVESRCHTLKAKPDLAKLGCGLFGFDSRKSPQDKARIMALNRRTVDYMVLEEGCFSD